MQIVKSVIKYLLITLLVSTYSTSIIGVGIYNCLCDHSGQLVLLANDACDCHHEHKCCQDHAQDQTTEEHCCKISYQVLQLDQDVNSSAFTFNNYGIAKSQFLPATFTKIPAPSLAACYNYDPPPLENSPAPDIYYLAQLRL